MYKPEEMLELFASFQQPLQEQPKTTSHNYEDIAVKTTYPSLY